MESRSRGPEQFTQVCLCLSLRSPLWLKAPSFHPPTEYVLL
jgi:hypothetical protein